MSGQGKLLISSSAYEYLTAEVAVQMQTVGATVSAVSRRTFADGERYQRLDRDAVAGRDVMIIGGLVDDRSRAEVYDLACAATQFRAKSLTVVKPFLYGQTQERQVKPGEVVLAKTIARQFSAIPAARCGNLFLLFDLHSEGIPYYFEGDAVAEHLYCKEITLGLIREFGGGDFVLCSTDAGRQKWVESLASELSVDVSYALKRRVGKENMLVAVEAHVKGRRVVIYDDMIRSGTSAIQAARAYKEAGAAEIFFVATHGVFPPVGDQGLNGLDMLRESGVFSAVGVTNTHPRAVELQAKATGFLRVASIAPLISKALLAL